MALEKKIWQDRNSLLGTEAEVQYVTQVNGHIFEWNCVAYACKK